MDAKAKKAKKATRPRTSEQLADAARLSAIYEGAKRDRGITQEQVAEFMGWKTQGAVSQYMRGTAALNIKALIGFASFFSVPHEDISPKLAEQVRKLGVKRPGDRFGTSKVDPFERIDKALSDLFILGPAKADLMAAIKKAADQGRAHQEEAIAEVQRVRNFRVKSKEEA